MSVRQQAVLLWLLAIAVGHVTLSGAFLLYVKESMRPWLLLAALVLLALGLASWLLDRRQRATAAPATYRAERQRHGHDHSTLRIGWLVLVPLFAMVFIAPPALQSYSAVHNDPLVYGSGHQDLAPLPPGGVVELSLRDYAQRAVMDSDTLAGRQVRVTGFAVPAPDGSSWSVARMVVFCCAADARSVVVLVEAAGAPPPRDSWVEVTGTWRAGPDGQPTISATTVTPIPAPENPYL